MKHIKRFNETDNWVGSLYAYDRSIPGKHDEPHEEEIFKMEPTTHYHCNDCKIGFYDYKPICKFCGSENVEKIIIESVENKNKELLDKELLDMIFAEFLDDSSNESMFYDSDVTGNIEYCIFIRVDIPFKYLFTGETDIKVISDKMVKSSEDLNSKMMDIKTATIRVKDEYPNSEIRIFPESNSAEYIEFQIIVSNH